MFRFTQEPSSGSAVMCLAKTTECGFSVLVGVDAVNVVVAYQPVVRGMRFNCTPAQQADVCISWNNKNVFDTIAARCKHEEC